MYNSDAAMNVLEKNDYYLYVIFTKFENNQASYNIHSEIKEWMMLNVMIVTIHLRVH